MLVLSRGPREKVVFPNLGISVEILRISGNRVRVGIDAPKEIRILRHELSDALNSQLQQAETSHTSQTDLHFYRNQVNTAQVALGLAEKQLNVGMQDKALETLRRAINQFDTLDRAIASSAPGAQSTIAAPPLPRALLVEDDINERELLSGYLQMSGFEVDTAKDGLQAMLHLGRQQRPDVVLLDMHMPRMNGPQTVESIRRTPELHGMRVFAVTGAEQSDLKVPVGPNGVDRWFQKPIKPQELVNCLQASLANREPATC